MMSRCDHKNIVKYMGTYSHGQDLWIVMEFCEGGKLTDLIMKTRFTEPEIAALCKESLLSLIFIPLYPVKYKREYKSIEP